MGIYKDLSELDNVDDWVRGSPEQQPLGMFSVCSGPVHGGPIVPTS